MGEKIKTIIDQVPTAEELAANQVSHTEDAMTPGALRAALTGDTRHAADLNAAFPAPSSTDRVGVVPAVIPELSREAYVPGPGETPISREEVDRILSSLPPQQ